MEEKLCNTCGEIRPRTEFGIRSSRDPRWRSQCATCRHTYLRERRITIKGSDLNSYNRCEEEILPGQKWCGGCREVKPTSDFHAGEKTTRCRSCKSLSGRKRHLAKYGMTPETYSALLDKQGGGCAVCGAVPDGDGAGRRFCIDHDHDCCPDSRTCGRCVRGILCTRCNAALGFVKDDPEHLMLLAAYVDAGGVLHA